MNTTADEGARSVAPGGREGRAFADSPYGPGGGTSSPEPSAYGPAGVGAAVPPPPAPRPVAPWLATAGGLMVAASLFDLLSALQFFRAWDKAEYWPWTATYFLSIVGDVVFAVLAFGHRRRGPTRWFALPLAIWAVPGLGWQIWNLAELAGSDLDPIYNVLLQLFLSVCSAGQNGLWICVAVLIWRSASAADARLPRPTVAVAAAASVLVVAIPVVSMIGYASHIGLMEIVWEFATDGFLPAVATLLLVMGLRRWSGLTAPGTAPASVRRNDASSRPSGPA